MVDAAIEPSRPCFLPGEQPLIRHHRRYRRERRPNRSRQRQPGRRPLDVAAILWSTPHACANTWHRCGSLRVG